MTLFVYFFKFRFASQIVKHVTKVIEVKWSLRNGKYLAEDRGAVVVSNHQSSIDVLGELIVFFYMNYRDEFYSD